MRFMMMMKASAASEAGHMPSEKLRAALGKYNEELAKAGVLVDVCTLQPSSKGARIRFSGRNRIVVDGPFAEAGELIAAYWIIQVESREEAIAWAKRIPFEAVSEPGDDGEVEIRPFLQLEDFASSPAHHRPAPVVQGVDRDEVRPRR